MPEADLYLRLGTCKFCRATIGWCTTENGKPMSLDLPSSTAGNVFVTVRDRLDVNADDFIAGPLLVGHVRHKDEQPEGTPYVPHIATCPNAPGRKTTKPQGGPQ